MFGKIDGAGGSQSRHKRNRQNISRESKGSKDNHKNKKRKLSPSTEALELSDRLKRLSREKKLDEALALFWDSSNNNIRDGHHACIMVDMTARCGKITEGELLLEKFAKQGTTISVETKTALLKGLCHSGKIGKAHDLFISMCNTKGKSNHPNVRTLNTLLRGCLWCAATSKGDGLVGGVATSEIAWEQYKNLDVAVDPQTRFDVSSYEYSITLLCQALQVDAAMKRISEMKHAFGVLEERKELESSNDQSLTEGLAIAYCALARAFTILKKEKQAMSAIKTSLDFAKASKDALKRGNSFSRKRGWKDNGNKEDGRRAESNSIYRNHRLSEIETEARTLMNIWKDTDINSVDTKVHSRELARRLVTRLVFLSGGGTTEMQTESGKYNGQDGGEKKDIAKEVQRDLLNSLYFSYGLDAPAKTLGISAGKDAKILRKKDCNRILGGVGLQGGILKGDGTLDLHRIFSAGIGTSKPQKKRKNKSRKVEVELGAGFGDWIVRKAIEDPFTDFVAVELRADRVAQIFARTAVLSTVKPVDNLCVVGADGGNLLCNHLSTESIDTIYVNHPEPPTQTFGAESTNLTSIMEGGKEPAHMLNSNVIIAVGNALKRNDRSRFVIVTDNFWYGRLICATIEKVMRQNSSLFRAVDLASADPSFKRVETYDDGGSSSVLLFEGKPNETIGYPSGSESEGGSYFDRLWRAGAGRHAEMHARYVTVLSPCSNKK